MSEDVRLQEGADWSILGEPGWEEVIAQVTRTYDSPVAIVDNEDVAQEARIIVATKAERYRRMLARGGWSLVSRSLLNAVIDLYKYELGHQNNREPLSVLEAEYRHE